MSPQAAITWRAEGIARSIISAVGISLPFTGITESIVIETFQGIWDTGATGSAITQNVVKKLNLPVTGQTLVNTANGPHISNTYLVNLTFPGGLGFQNVVVNEAKLGENVDVLIGMDIITMGDFSITNSADRTVMSFQVPSCLEVDFVQRANDRKMSATSKGRGKKRKK